jgi:hypothetical protein
MQPWKQRRDYTTSEFKAVSGDGETNENLIPDNVYCFLSPSRSSLRTLGSISVANAEALRIRPLYSSLRLNLSEPT